MRETVEVRRGEGCASVLEGAHLKSALKVKLDSTRSHLADWCCERERERLRCLGGMAFHMKHLVFSQAEFTGVNIHRMLVFLTFHSVCSFCVCFSFSHTGPDGEREGVGGRQS